MEGLFEKLILQQECESESFAMWQKSVPGRGKGKVEMTVASSRNRKIGKAQEDGARAQVAADEGRVVSRVRSWRVLSTSVRGGFYSERDEKSS